MEDMTFVVTAAQMKFSEKLIKKTDCVLTFKNTVCFCMKENEELVVFIP